MCIAGDVEMNTLHDIGFLAWIAIVGVLVYYSIKDYIEEMRREKLNKYIEKKG